MRCYTPQANSCLADSTNNSCLPTFLQLLPSTSVAAGAFVLSSAVSIHGLCMFLGVSSPGPGSVPRILLFLRRKHHIYSTRIVSRMVPPTVAPTISLMPDFEWRYGGDRSGDDMFDWDTIDNDCVVLEVSLKLDENMLLAESVDLELFVSKEADVTESSVARILLINEPFSRANIRATYSVRLPPRPEELPPLEMAQGLHNHRYQSTAPRNRTCQAHNRKTLDYHTVSKSHWRKSGS